MVRARASRVDAKASLDAFEEQHNGYGIYTGAYDPSRALIPTDVAEPPDRMHRNTQTHRTAPTPHIAHRPGVYADAPSPTQCNDPPWLTRPAAYSYI